jgi:hypothetical protein
MVIDGSVLALLFQLLCCFVPANVVAAKTGSNAGQPQLSTYPPVLYTSKTVGTPQAIEGNCATRVSESVSLEYGKPYSCKYATFSTPADLDLFLEQVGPKPGSECKHYLYIQASAS